MCRRVDCRLTKANHALNSSRLSYNTYYTSQLKNTGRLYEIPVNASVSLTMLNTAENTALASALCLPSAV